jgi:hypothetical protein
MVWNATKSPTQDTVHKACHEAEVAALKEFHDGKTSVDEAAKETTQPISNSSIQDLGDYADDATALRHLWALLINALIDREATWIAMKCLRNVSTSH